MLLSDRDLLIEIEAGRLAVDPFDATLVQPSSIDVRLDALFRVFNNGKYTHIDPSIQQDDLTRLVEIRGADPFVLHPGEFILGSTFECVTLPDTLAGRLEGKALALDTEVPTPSGWRTMGDLRVGDEVFDDAGHACTVVSATAPLWGRPCRRVELSDHSHFIADATHQWLTIDKNSRKHHASRVAVRTTDEIASSLKAGDELNHHIPLGGVAEYPHASLPIDPYVLGYWLGDGTATKAEVTIGTVDEAFVRREFEMAGFTTWRASGPHAFRVGRIGHGQSRRRRDANGRYSGDESLSGELRRLGLMGNKHVPVSYRTSDRAQRLALLQGLMDSDGYVDVFGRCEFVSVRECLADAVHEVAASLGLRPVKRKKRAMLNGIDCGPAYQVKFTPRVEVFRLPRKRARLRTDARSHGFRAVAAVTPVPSVPVRCIQVSAASGAFLIGRSYVPTHNSSLGRLGLLTHSTAGFIDPGFSGHITLELSNVANLPITLWPGMKIGQLCVFRLSSPSLHPYGSAVYGSHYQGQRGPTPSRSWQHFRRDDVTR